MTSLSLGPQPPATAQPPQLRDGDASRRRSDMDTDKVALSLSLSLYFNVW